MVANKRGEREVESELEVLGHPNRTRGLMRSKRRVADHGEVFTPAWLVDQMLDLVHDESERIDSRVLEPACGSGNFLVPMLRRKLTMVHLRYGKSEFERRHQALLGLMCLYGIELLDDNVNECRANLLRVITDYLGGHRDDHWYNAAQNVLRLNIIHGDAISMTTKGGRADAITFPEWAYVGRGMYQRRDFRYDTLTQMSSFGEGTLFADLAPHEIFTPTREYGSISVTDIASWSSTNE
jgi:hypothetical protein